MEGLAFCARGTFNTRPAAFRDGPDDDASDMCLRPGMANRKVNIGAEPVFDTVELRHGLVGNLWSESPEMPPLSKRSQQSESDLFNFFSDHGSGEVVPHLKLVNIKSRSSARRIEAPASGLLDIRQSVFHRLLDVLRANPWVLWLIVSRYDGFHYTKATDQYADTYFFGSLYSALVWTFHPSTASTKILLIDRAPFQNGNLYTSLQAYAPHLCTPFVPLMAVAVSCMLSLDERLDYHVGNIIDVENGTGFSVVNQESSFKFDIDALAQWSRLSARTQTSITNLCRHHEICIRALDAVVQLCSKETSIDQSIECSGDYGMAIKDMLDAIHVLRMRADAFTPYANYLKSRAQVQVNVIFALLTHEDSTSNLKAAEASMAIAAATRRDSSAMKTIAFMTMAFLPATFLATLFALPLLQWEHKTSVRMDGFQLYWIVAILSTAAVFAAWAMITNWEWMSLRARPNRKGEKKSGAKKFC